MSVGGGTPFALNFPRDYEGELGVQIPCVAPYGFFFQGQTTDATPLLVGEWDANGNGDAFLLSSLSASTSGGASVAAWFPFNNINTTGGVTTTNTALQAPFFSVGALSAARFQLQVSSNRVSMYLVGVAATTIQWGFSGGIGEVLA